MDLRDLECFVAVAETGSVTAASARLNRVQSGISVRLKNLEDDLGAELFERIGKRLELNSAGERFLLAARDLLLRADQARQLLNADTPGGRLRIASMEAAAAAHMPALLNRFHARYPTVQLELKSLASWPGVAAVENGDVDIAFVSADAISDNLESRPVFKEELVLVTGVDHPPIRSAADIAEQPLLVFESGCAYRARLERWVQQQQSRPFRRIELGSYHTLLGCAAAGTGVGMVPRSLLAVYPAADLLRIHRLPRALSRDQTCMVWHPARTSPNHRALLSLLKR